MAPAKTPRTLLIVSHVRHYKHAGGIDAYVPYAREIDMWADLFPRVIIAAPCCEQEPPDDTAPFTRKNISIIPQRETGGHSLSAKIYQLLILPSLVWNLGRAMRGVDAIHVRCPGNLGLIGAVLAPLFSSCLVAKFAGQWNGYPGEAWTVKLQKMILRSPWWRGPVTVYGQWPNQPSKVIPFFSSAMTKDQLARAHAHALGKTPPPHLRILYVGRLSTSKNVDVLLRAMAELVATGLRFECTIVGEGPERSFLEGQASELQLGMIRFVGAIGFERVLDYYAQSDVLVLTSETEGWPKVIAEGMAFGVICIGSDRGLVPQMLDQGRGIVIDPRDVKGLAGTIQQIAEAPAAYQSMGVRAAEWAQRYSLDALREALGDLLSTQWGVSLSGGYRWK
jgi:glycosyltransferase involved in cell wall biosynthesis